MVQNLCLLYSPSLSLNSMCVCTHSVLSSIIIQQGDQISDISFRNAAEFVRSYLEITVGCYECSSYSPFFLDFTSIAANTKCEIHEQLGP